MASMTKYTSAGTRGCRIEAELDGRLAIKTRDLTKRYGSGLVAVSALNLSVARGEIYGFLGPNGAGKTTTIRMLLGLIEPTSGSVEVFGVSPGSRSGRERIGALVESPAFYPYLSGLDNLKGLASMAGVQRPQGRIDTVLKQVGLAGRGRDKFGKYSLGMKQRLGIAAALLKQPEIVVLDEPTNGLDPRGAAEMRSLIRSLGQEGRTVLLSSHLMGEVEEVCDRIGIIHHGTLVAEGTTDELKGEGELLIRAEPLEQAARIAKELAGAVRVDGDMLWLSSDPGLSSEIAQRLISGGLRIIEMRQVQPSLEQVFFRLTGEG